MSNLINSEISSTVSHVVVKQHPDRVKILPSVGRTIHPSFWDGVSVPILIQPFKGNTPVYYAHTSNPSLTAYGADSYTFDDVEPLTANAWDLVSACGVAELGSYMGILTPWVSGGAIGTKIDDCGNVIQVPIATSNEGSLDACLMYNHPVSGSVELCTSVSALNFNSLEDPLALKQHNANTTYLDYMCKFDIKDNLGRGVIFGNSESEVTKLLKTVFGDEFTSSINEKILNFQSNVRDLDLADTMSVDELGTNLGVSDSGLSNGAPVEIQTLLKLSSIRYEDLFGVENIGDVYNPSNVGEFMVGSDMVSAGEVLFTRRNATEDELQPYIVRSKIVKDRLEEGFLDGESVYPLSALDDVDFNTTDYRFWRNNFVAGYTVNEIIDLDTIMEIPTKREWAALIDKRIQYFLVANLLG